MADDFDTDSDVDDSSAIDLAGLGGAGGALDPRSLGMAQQGMGSLFSQIEAANQRKVQILDKIMADYQSSRQGRSNLPMMALAQGLLSPTKTGSIGESIGSGLGAMIPAIAQQRADEDRFSGKIGELELTKAGINDALYGKGIDTYSKMILAHAKSAGPKSALGKLISDYKSGIIQDPKMFQAMVNKLTTRSEGTGVAIDFGTDDKGNTTIGGVRIGPGLPTMSQIPPKMRKDVGDASAMTTGTQSDVDKLLIDNLSTLEQLSTLQKEFDPSYFQNIPQAKNWLAGQKEKWGIGKLNPEQQKYMQGFEAYQAKTMNFFNQLLKNRSGAAVTPQEYDRLVKEVGSLDTASPTQFSSRVAAINETLRLAQARLRYLKEQNIWARLDPNKGITMGKDIDLNGMQGIINRDYGTIIENLVKEGKSEAEAKKAAQQAIRQKYGL